MQLANQEAQRLRHEYIGTEHILLGLVLEGSGVAANVLKNLDVSLRQVREEVEKLIIAGPADTADTKGNKLPQTPKAKKVVKYAMAASRELNHNYIGSEHLLLGLLREQDGVAARVLAILGVTLDKTTTEILNLLGPGLSPVSQETTIQDSLRQYERFTDRARKIMQLANQEAQRLRHEYIGTEHILLGLMLEGSGVAANLLKNLHVNLRQVRLEVEKLVIAGPADTKGKLPKTPNAKKVIDYAMAAARELNHNYIGSEHLLLGLLREQDGVAAQVLANLGVTSDKTTTELLNLLGPGSSPVSQETTIQDSLRHRVPRWMVPAIVACFLVALAAGVFLLFRSFGR
jgi:ATP-dependent Clp protease ATP-binding subunit ClpA